MPSPFRAFDLCNSFRVSALALVVISLLVTVVPVADAQTYSVLYNFGGVDGDPGVPTGVIAQGRDGSLYSTGLGGPQGGGAVFKITPSGKLTVLYGFTNGDYGCCAPTGGLTLGTDGNFYGSTQKGLDSSCGGGGCGAIFKITPKGELSVLYQFTGGSDGANPQAPPIQGVDGNFYGTATNGGNVCSPACGTLYKLTPSGKFTTLYSFTDNQDGESPVAALVQGTDGSLYGTTPSGGLGHGAVFKITPQGKFTVLDASHSGYESALIQGNDGNFYGTSRSGGDNGVGFVFKIGSAGKFSILYNFTCGSDGCGPYAGLVEGTDGKYYGAATSFADGCGTIFSITSKGKFTTLYPFPSDGSMGCNPFATLLQHTSGTLYGDTYEGGAFNEGVFYSLNAALPPFASFLPAAGKVGKTIEFLGQGFKGATTVSFNGTPASFKIVSDTYLTATVPDGATTGPVTVTTPGGTLNSNKSFLVTPKIISFSPPSGPPGTLVTIVGDSLTQTTKVTFGGVKATSFSVDSDTQVTATVPVGAKTGKIAITTPGGIAKSATDFTVTP